jgi:glycine cleavage system aminomethyltransferase T
MSGGYGPSVEATIAFAYLPVALAHPGMELAVDLLGERVRAVVVQDPLYDADNRRLRGESGS